MEYNGLVVHPMKQPYVVIVIFLYLFPLQLFAGTGKEDQSVLPLSQSSDSPQSSSSRVNGSIKITGSQYSHTLHPQITNLISGTQTTSTPPSRVDARPVARENDSDAPPIQQSLSDEQPHATVKKQNRLIVEESKNSDISTVYLSKAKMDELELHQGDTVEISGKLKKSTYGFVLEDDAASDEHIRLNRTIRSNAGVKLGDTVRIRPQYELIHGKRVQILPIKDTVEGLSGNLFDIFLKPHFDGRYRPVKPGDVFPVKAAMRTVEFKVMETDPERGCIVAPDTVLHCEGEPIDRQKESLTSVGYDDLGGLKKQIQQIRELVEHPLRHPDVYAKAGVKPPKGLLLYGPSGSGKTQLVQAIANETGAFLFTIHGPEIISKISGQSEENLRKAFEESGNHSPAIIFIDEIDTIAPNRDKTQEGVERRIVSQLLTLLDGLDPKKPIIVIGATNRPDALDPALRRYGRFEHEIDIGIPDRAGRLEILKIHTADKNLAEDVDLEKIAKDSHGYTGSDLAALCNNAARYCINENPDLIDLDSDEIDVEVVNSLKVSHAHFQHALKSSSPSGLRENVVEVPVVSWDDIGGHDEIKQELIEMIQDPQDYPDIFEKLGLEVPQGVLLYGPTGTGKTQLAKAVANECNANFISVKGPELLSKWFGTSEQNVRQLFKKARLNAPCILFFDEFDAIAQQRGEDGGEAQKASDRIINQFLTELDGISESKGVYVIAATNLPERIDTALMRPGRLSKHFHVRLPDKDARHKIFKASLKKSPVSEDVDLLNLARATPGFSGADIASICRRAGQLAARDAIARRKENKRQRTDANAATGATNEDPAVRLTRNNFEEAMRTARHSVSAADVAKYEAFEQRSKLNTLDDFGSPNQTSTGWPAASSTPKQDGLFD